MLARPTGAPRAADLSLVAGECVSATEPAPAVGLSSDVHTAFRNAFKLGSSILATWGVALLVRLYLPRYLGPHDFGLYSFADSFALTGIGLLGLGTASYIQTEIPRRPRHASDFLGGVFVIRLALAVVVLAALWGILEASGRPPEAQRLVLIFGIAYFLVLDNSNLAALLQANTTVSELAFTNVAAKVLWAMLLGLAMFVRAPIEWLVAGFVASEAAKAFVLSRVVRRKMDVRFRIDLKAAATVIAASLPLYTHAMALSLNRLDITVLTFLTEDNAQVGWYGASVSLAGLALMLGPLLPSVLLPLMSRAHARSTDDLWRVVRAAAEGLIVVALPISLFVALSADVVVTLAFGSAYAPAAVSLRALAPQFFFTYLAALFSMTMVVLGRGWRLTAISIFGVLLNPLLGLLFIPVCARLLGVGGAGAGAALGVVGMEVLVSALMLHSLGRGALDPRTRRVALGALVACTLTAGLHVLLAPLGPWRLGLDLVAYAGLAWLCGALPVERLLSLARETLASRKGAPA